MNKEEFEKELEGLSEEEKEFIYNCVGKLFAINALKSFDNMMKKIIFDNMMKKIIFDNMVKKINKSIIDDNNYLDGEYVEFDSEIPYIIVVGQRAIGKGVYSKAMSKYNKGIQYYSTQQLSYLDRRIREGSIDIISIQKI